MINPPRDLMDGDQVCPVMPMARCLLSPLSHSVVSEVGESALIFDPYGAHTPIALPSLKPNFA